MARFPDVHFSLIRAALGIVASPEERKEAINACAIGKMKTRASENPEEFKAIYSPGHLGFFGPATAGSWGSMFTVEDERLLKSLCNSEMAELGYK